MHTKPGYMQPDHQIDQSPKHISKRSQISKAQSHRMGIAQVGSNLKDHQVPAPLPGAGLPTARSSKLSGKKLKALIECVR